MKIRAGFVSNSSSSSFTCDVCGMTETGWDGDYGDVNTYNCSNGHSLCEDCLSVKPQDLARELCKKYPVADNKGLAVEICEGRPGWYTDEEYEKWIANVEGDLNYCSEEEREDCVLEMMTQDELHSQCCPICRFEFICERDMKRYFLKETRITEEEVFAEIKKVNKRRRKLYDNEYITHCCVATGKTTTTVSEEIKERFGSYEKFNEYLEGEE